MDIQKLRQRFEELPDIKSILHGSDFGFNESLNQYYHPDHTNHRLNYAFIMGAWMAWQVKAQAVPEGFNFGLAHDTKINDPKELLFRCLRKMKYSNRFHSIQNWVHVRDLCELGSGTAFKLCNFLNVDPDSNEFKRIEAQEQSHD